LIKLGTKLSNDQSINHNSAGRDEIIGSPAASDARIGDNLI
jgi:hypothetical protein